MEINSVGVVCEESAFKYDLEWYCEDACSRHGGTHTQFCDDIYEMAMEVLHGEMQGYRDHGVYEKVPLKQCFGRTKKTPIGCRWVIISKGDK